MLAPLRAAFVSAELMARDHKGRCAQRQADGEPAGTGFSARAGSREIAVINNAADRAGKAWFAQKMTALLPSIYLKFTK